MKVQIMSEQVETRSFPAQNGKAATSFTEQKAAIERPGDFPLPFKITLDDGQQPYKIGTYELCPTSLQSGKYGGLEFGRRVRLLTPSPAPAPTTAPARSAP